MMKVKYLNLRAWTQLLFILLFLALLVSCQGNTSAPNAPTPSPSRQPESTANSMIDPNSVDPFFPQAREAHADSMTALIEGQLVLINGCLRIQDSQTTSSLLIWPYGYLFNRKENSMQVYDGAGNAVARVGDTIKVGGGEWPSEYIGGYVAQPLPGACSGPYWIVASIEK